MKKLYVLALSMLLSASISIMEAAPSSADDKKVVKAKGMRAHKAKKAGAEADSNGDEKRNKHDGDHKKAFVKKMQENGPSKEAIQAKMDEIRAKAAAKRAGHEKGSMKNKMADKNAGSSAE